MARISPEQISAYQTQTAEKPQRALDLIADSMVKKFGPIGNLPVDKHLGQIMYVANGFADELTVTLTDLDVQKNTARFQIKCLVTSDEKEVELGLEEPYMLRDDVALLVDHISPTEARTHWLAPKKVKFRRSDQKPLD